MRILYWIIRGIANSPSRLALRRLILLHKPDIVCIAEPWMNFAHFPSSWLHRLGFKIFSINERGNLLPNLWRICTLDLYPTIISKDDQQVTFTLPVHNSTFCFSAIYASADHLHRKALWHKLSLLQQQHHLPWAFIGDFNVILESHEHSGRFPPARNPILDFQTWTDNHDLLHLPTRGATFTWDNRISGNRHTKKRLDRTICNQLLLDSCSLISCSTLTKTNSDHYPLLLDLQITNQSFASNFKFLKMWTLHSDCKNIVSDTWITRIIGCPMYILTTKLKILKNKLKQWNKEVFGNIHNHVNEAGKNLADIQQQIDTNGHSDDLMNAEKLAQLKLDDALNKQEVFWKEKARMRWHVDGDRNTRYFHRVTKIKNKTKIISSLRNDEEIITDPQRISNHIVNYYEKKFASNFVLQDTSLVEEVIPSLIDESTNRLLTMVPSNQEIKEVVLTFIMIVHLAQMDLLQHSSNVTGKLFKRMLLKLSLSYSLLAGFFQTIMQIPSF